MHSFSDKSTNRIALSILTKEYATAPNITWIVKPGKWRMRLFFSYLVNSAIEQNGAYITEDNKGVLFLYRIPQKSDSFLLTIQKLITILFAVGIKHAIQVIRAQKMQNSIRPNYGLYAMALAIEAGNNRLHAGMEIKRELYRIQERTQLPVYAETTNIRYAKLYEALGFQVYHKVKHPYNNLDIYFLKREATAQQEAIQYRKSG